MASICWKCPAALRYVTRLSIHPSNNQSLGREFRRRYSIQIKCRSALVTGGARGIGYHIAESLLDNGLQNVLLVDVMEKQCEKAAEKLNKRYGSRRAFACKCDVSNTEDMEVLFKGINSKYLDILINSPSIDDGLNLERTFDSNLKGIVNGTLLGFKYLREGGCIINLSSVHGLQPFYGSPIFCGTQYFSVGLTRSVGTDFLLERTKIKVMALCPGATKMDPEEKKKYGIPFFSELGDIQDCSREQDPGEVGKCVLAMLEDGENGSVWVSEDCECYKCQFIDWRRFKRLPLVHC